MAWTIDIDDAGRITGVDVRRAIVRSRDRLDYATARHDDGDPRIALLGEIGERLIAAEAARGGEPAAARAGGRARPAAGGR